MRMKRMGFMVATLALAGALPLQANNIRVANVATGHQDIENQQAYVAFDLSWENSWRNDVNWDAAWVFVKFRPAGSNEWQHAYLSTNKADHIMPAGAAVDVGTTEIGGTDRGTGAFIYRNGAHTGDVSYVNTRLLWKYGENGYNFARGAQVEFSVHAIEMVFVAEGAFYVGSGGLEQSSFTDGEWSGGATTPFMIGGEGSLLLTNSAGKLWATGNISPSVLPAEYPKGYAAFYCMKYTITQGQYAEFLNLLTTVQADARFPNQYPNKRYTIRFVNGMYTADAPDRACNYVTWAHFAAYAAWAGLRPMTEMEFEKACRGPELPVANEYAWGTSVETGLTGFSGTDGSGTETALPSNANYRMLNSGPVRVGIFAAANSDRVSSGASYWGLMEMSGNLAIMAVTLGNATGQGYTGIHGNGMLTAAGNADIPQWPPSNGVGAGTRANQYYCSYWSRVSCRQNAIGGYLSLDNIGGRAVRSAPSGI